MRFDDGEAFRRHVELGANAVIGERLGLAREIQGRLAFLDRRLEAIELADRGLRRARRNGVLLP